jgi:hypothetical protein
VGGLGDEFVELVRNPGDVRPRSGNVLVDALVCNGKGGVPGKRCAPGEKLEQQDPGGIDVAAGIRDPGRDLLGRQVRGGTEDDAVGRGVRRCCGTHQTEVGDLHLTAVGNQDVLRFDVPVHESGTVSDGQRVENRSSHRGHGMRRHRPALAQQFP